MQGMTTSWVSILSLGRLQSDHTRECCYIQQEPWSHHTHPALHASRFASELLRSGWRDVHSPPQVALLNPKSSFSRSFKCLNFVCVVDVNLVYRRAVYKTAKMSHESAIPSRSKCEVLLKCCALLVVAKQFNSNAGNHALVVAVSQENHSRHRFYLLF